MGRGRGSGRAGRGCWQIVIEPDSGTCPRKVVEEGVKAWASAPRTVKHPWARRYRRGGAPLPASMRKRQALAAGRASGRIPREKEKEKNKFDAVETRSELTNVYKYANGRVPMPGYDLPSGEALRETYLASLGAHPGLPAYGRGINWGATERSPAPIERDRKSGRIMGTLHGGKGAEPTVNDIVAEFMRALNAAGLRG
eukprot:scaffold5366_cov128-Isochrysis_galbana.AAC.8